MVMWSINERLAGRDGVNVPIPDTSWIDELAHIAIEESESADGGSDLDDLLEEMGG